jgi:thioredoxin 1
VLGVSQEIYKPRINIARPFLMVRRISLISLEGIAQRHAKSRHDVHSDLGLACDPRIFRGGRRVSFLSLCGVQNRSLSDYEKPVAQHHLWGDTWRNVRCPLTTGIGPIFLICRISCKQQWRGNTMLQTNLQHLFSAKDLEETIKSHENVMVCCGRMGPMCIPVYEVMDELQGEYSHVAFRDMEFDTPDAAAIRNLPECSSFRGLPFTVYFNNGKVVKATSSIQNRDQVTQILDAHFTGKTVSQ